MLPQYTEEVDSFRLKLHISSISWASKMSQIELICSVKGWCNMIQYDSYDVSQVSWHFLQFLTVQPGCSICIWPQNLNLKKEK